jgi:hypothetical protein
MTPSVFFPSRIARATMYSATSRVRNSVGFMMTRWPDTVVGMRATGARAISSGDRPGFFASAFAGNVSFRLVGALRLLHVESHSCLRASRAGGPLDRAPGRSVDRHPEPSRKRVDLVPAELSAVPGGTRSPPAERPPPR